jgi:hypothetical protein
MQQAHIHTVRFLASSQAECGDPSATESPTSTIFSNTSLERDGGSRGRNSISKCAMIGVRLVACPRSRHVVEVIADLLSRANYT